MVDIGAIGIFGMVFGTFSVLLLLGVCTGSMGVGGWVGGWVAAFGLVWVV
jgi:hypothetical protein